MKNVYNEMHSITLKEFDEWVTANKKYTWFTGLEGGWGKDGTALFKYFILHFDTRDMTIYAINSRDFHVSTTNQMVNKIVQKERFVSILDYLNYLIKEELKK